MRLLHHQGGEAGQDWHWLGDQHIPHLRQVTLTTDVCQAAAVQASWCSVTGGGRSRVLFTAGQLCSEDWLVGGSLQHVLSHGDQLQFHAVPHTEQGCQWMASLVWRTHQASASTEKVCTSGAGSVKYRPFSSLKAGERLRDCWTTGRASSGGEYDQTTSSPSSTPAASTLTV